MSLNGEKSNDQSRAVTHSKHMGDSPSEKADSQQTISGVIPDRTGHNGQGNGALMVHQNKTVDERMRRLKPESHEKFIPSAILLRDRGTVMIREDGTRSPATFPMYESSQRRSDSRKENPSLDLDTLMASENVENMVMTREDENEVDKLVDEFGDVVMDDNMSKMMIFLWMSLVMMQKSLMRYHNCLQKMLRFAVSKNQHGNLLWRKQLIRDQMKKKSSGRDKSAGEGRHSGLPSGADLKKKVPRSPD
ncbi:hypothetical protein HID58_002041, partial [Brassica napus]